MNVLEMSPHPTQQKVSFVALEICAFTDNSHACETGLLIIYLFLASVRVKKKREKQETKPCSSNLPAETGRLVETFP